MIAIGSDHGGFALKQEIMEHLKEMVLNIKIMAVMMRAHVIIRFMQKKLQTQ